VTPFWAAITSSNPPVVLPGFAHLNRHIRHHHALGGIEDDQRASPTASPERAPEQPVAEPPADGHVEPAVLSTELLLALPASDSSRTPLTAPPHARTDCTRATDRTLPKPLAAGICP
jgi:hypothetical protein